MNTDVPLNSPSAERSDHTPAGTVTFLFSDIERSTHLLQQLGNGYADILAAQRRLLRAAFNQWGGEEIDTAGDGFFVAFSRARDAVAAAATAQLAVSRHGWPEGVSVRIRMGLHTGESVMTDGTYVGLDVHRAARICAAGHGGQVLLSQVTRDLVERDCPLGVSLRDLGVHRLKDLTHPEPLHQLVIPNLPSEFPPLNTITGQLYTLPTQPTTFIGRREEIETVRMLLLRDAVRILTLAGPGGTGKTRLALEAAAELKDSFSDGVCLVALATITDPELVASGIAFALGVVENPTSTVIESVKGFLRKKHLLLLLDNFEQVVVSAPTVAGLIAACPRIKILITSRVVLHISGEYEYQVPALPVPNPKHLSETSDLAQFSSVALFVERARAVRPGFYLSDENASAVARICNHLEGLPLAIELAAARVKLFSPQAILARLGSRFDLLRSGARDLHPRHQTLRQAIAWSYDLLREEEKAFFRRLSVFMGGCTLEAADQVCATCEGLELDCSGCGASPDALDAAAALVDQSLLRREESPEGEPRFVMLETIREYGLERLREAGEEMPIRRTHAEYFLALAERAERELTGPQQALWLSRLEVEHDNLRAALTWSLEQTEAEIGLRLGAALWRFWIVKGYMVEGREHLQRLLALPDGSTQSQPRAAVLNGLGTLIHEIGDYQTARPLLEESLAIWRNLGDRLGMSSAMNNLGWVLTMLNDHPAGFAHSMEALTICRELGENRGQAVALTNLAWQAHLQGDPKQACLYLEEGLVLRRAIGDRRGMAYMMTCLSEEEMALGHADRATTLIEEALATLRALGDKQLIANAIQAHAMIAYELGHLEKALVLMEDSTSLWREVGNRSGGTEAMIGLATILADAGESVRARALFEEALTRSDIKGLRGSVLYGLGRLAHRSGDLPRAFLLLEESLSLRKGIRDRRGIAEALDALAGLHVDAGKSAEAARLLGEAQALREAIGVPVPLREQIRRGELIEVIRARLGESEFEAAWREGQDATKKAFP
jgi:predicted ATPase/class 3 adenylate cyclase